MSPFGISDQQEQNGIDQDAVVVSHVRRHAREYGLMNGALHTTVLLEKRTRRQSAIYRFAAHPHAERVILVKVPLPNSADNREDRLEDASGAEGRPARPRIVPLLDFAMKYRCEYAALDAMERHFSELGDPRFGAVRVLDRIDGLNALVMEEIHEPNLRRLFGAASRLSVTRPRDLEPIFRNAGAWLREFHGLPALKGQPVLQAQRVGFVEKVCEFAEYLERQAGYRDALCRIADTVSEAAESLLPERMPVGLRHGDWAMRNVLVSPDNRVVVLDTLAYCQTPVYDDIAYFLTELKRPWPQIYSGGLAFSTRRLEEYEQAFLEGYFGPAVIPWPAIRLFEVQAVLDKWAARAARDRLRPLRPHHIAERLHRRIVGAAFGSILEQLRRQVASDAAPSGPRRR